MTNKKSALNLVLSAMFLAIALLLPLLTGQIPQIGKMLCPMHIPVILCGFICGPWNGALVGVISPLLRFLLFGLPILVPTGIAMCAELAIYGLAAGILYRKLPRKKIYIYISLIGSMLAGRVAWGLIMIVLMGIGKTDFGWQAFFAGGFINALPGIVVQIVIIPIIIMSLERAQILKKK